MKATVVPMVAIAMTCLLLGGAKADQPPSSSARSSQATTASTVVSATSTTNQNPGSSNTPEMTSQESPTTFKVNVRLVQVRVVVRDANGNVIGTLKKDDFKLFDNGKLQVISKFDIEKPGQRVAEAEKSSESSSASANVSSVNAALPAIPERYIAYLFDDVHLVTADLLPVRQAALKNLDTLQPTDRAAIFTTSGRNEVDFTDDKNKLRQTLDRLMTHSISDDSTIQCPKVSYYIADLIHNKHDQQALAAVTQDALDCAFSGDPKFTNMAQHLAEQAASQEVVTGDTETRLALASLKDIVRRLAAAPGQRSVILVSPGFITPLQEYEVGEVIDRALRADVTVSALDARGLYAIVPGGDASEPGTADPRTAGIEAQYQTATASANGDVMAELADGTGGNFLHNNNDLLGGLRQLASTPEYSYVLGFSPQNLKTDGRFHKLKVELNSHEKYSLQARRGYFAPKQLFDSDQQAKQEIEDAVFSQEEIHDLPIDLHTQFFKPSDMQAKLTVLAHVDVKQLHFQKVDGRNNDDLTVVSVIFDRNGNFVIGLQKLLQLHLKDETLATKLSSGLSLKSNFDLKPGGYLVRLVVRDAHGQIAAENGVVEIP